MCVKENFPLSDYTPDESKIEICDDRAQSISLNSDYNKVKKISDKCSKDLKQCEKDKNELKT